MYERKYCSRITFVLCVCPSVCGWKAVLNRLSTPKFFVVSFHNFEVNRFPLSVRISLHQQKKFHLMYYIHISLYCLVIPSPLIPPIPPVVTSCSKGPWSFQGAPYIPSAPFIHIFVRRSTLAPLANWSRLTDPCFFLPYYLGHFGLVRPLRTCAHLEKPLLGLAPHITLGTFSSPGFLRYGFCHPDFSVTEFVPQGTFFRSSRAPSVPVLFAHLFLISIVHVPNWLVSLHSPNLVHFVLPIVLVETSWFA